MIKLTMVDREVIVIADRNIPENRRYLLVSYKEYAEIKEAGAEEVPNSGPDFWDNLLSLEEK